jgi:two-component system response regulator AtoC
MPVSKILVIDDDTSMLSLAKLHLQEQGYEVTLADTSGQGLKLAAAEHFDLALTDFNLPDLDGIELVKRLKEASPETEIIMITGYGSVAKAVEAIKAGAFYYVEKPVDFAELQVLIDKAIERREQAQELRQLRGKLAERDSYYNIIGSSRAMQHIYAMIESIADSDANVLIVGESGTGKELVANAIHYRSRRAKRPFMQVNCAALPKELIESELFGHTKGAFTGATGDKVGLIGRAAGGSLLLDEISEMPVELQPKLLRVLQERVYYRLGSEKPLEADFRLLAATNRDPLQAIRDGQLREDLYYRINTIEMQVPPLRERAEDIQHLADHFLRKFAEKYQRPVTAISGQAYQRLFDYQWPGNVRELQNTIERGVLLCKDERIGVEHLSFANAADVAAESALPEAVPAAPASAAAIPEHYSIEQLCQLIIRRVPEPKAGEPLNDLFKRLEAYLAQAAVGRTKGNKQAAANLLGIYRPRLYNLLKRYEEQNGAPKESQAAAPPASSAGEAEEETCTERADKAQSAWSGQAG